jgi:ArsR family transcriptional regulator
MVLREAGLVEDRRDGWNIFYRVVEPAVYDLLDAARQITGESTEPAGNPQGAGSKACPCPKCNPEKEAGRC